jgi:sulfonate transport system permease protein
MTLSDERLELRLGEPAAQPPGFDVAELDADATDAWRAEDAGLVRLETAESTQLPKASLLRSRGPQRLIGVALLIGIWELASLAGWLKPQDLAGPSAVITTGAHLLANGTLETALWASVQRVFWGLAIGVPLGAALALASGLTRTGENLIDGNVQMLRFVPIIGLESLFILWLGVGETAKISMITLGVMFPIYINTFAAIRAIDPRYGELADVLGLGRWARIRRIVLPAALAGFLVGLRMAMAVAWLLLVFAEQINASSGLGYLMVQAQAFFESNVIVVCLACYAILGLLTDALVRALERVALRWQPGR